MKVSCLSKDNMISRENATLNILAVDIDYYHSVPINFSQLAIDLSSMHIHLFQGCLALPRSYTLHDIATILFSIRKQKII